MKFSNRFVCEDLAYSTYTQNIPAPIFRKSFTISKKVHNAQIIICGLGFYDIYINGKKITKGYLAPYISNTDHYIYYDKYDVTSNIHNGENVIGIMLGDGFLVGKQPIWAFDKNVMNAAPMLALTVEINCENETILYDAEDFVCKKGPILFNDLRSGVFYDARLAEKGWNDIGFKEEKWHSPIKVINKPRGKAKLCEAEPIKVYREIKPISIKKGKLDEGRHISRYKDVTPFENGVDKENGYIYDFGENNSGIYRLKIKGKNGQKINIQCAEQLHDGKVNYQNICFYPEGFTQRDIYYLTGNGEEIFEPMFTFHGYRYIYINGITEEQAADDLLTYLVMSSDTEQTGTFACASDRVNAIYQMCRKSDMSNFFYFPMDCPHREKNGWTGDAALSAEHMIMTMDAEKSWCEWLHNIRASQKENGQLPGIIPTGDWGYKWGNGPAWDCVLFELPYMLYKYRGNAEVITANAAAMLRYLEYASACRNEKGLVKMGLGDYLPVNKGAEEYDSDLGFTDSVMILNMCRKAETMFDAVGLHLHKDFAISLGEEMLSAIRNEYVDLNTYIVKNKCQTSQAMALYYGVFSENEQEKAFNVLMDIIKADEYKFTCGILGMRVFFHVLAKFGKADLAYKMITRKEFPSYGYWLDKGETTLLEHFFEYDDYYNASKNHHFFGDVANWFMRTLGGLCVNAVNCVTVSPCFLEEINWCKTSYKFPDGEIKIQWQRKDGCISLDITTTGNVTYEYADNNNAPVPLLLNGCEYHKK